MCSLLLGSCYKRFDECLSNGEEGAGGRGKGGKSIRNRGFTIRPPLGVMTDGTSKARDASCADLKCQGEEMVTLDVVCPDLPPPVPASAVTFYVVFHVCGALLVS